MEIHPVEIPGARKVPAVAVHSIEEIVASEPRVVLDLSGVTAVDLRGLEAIPKLRDGVRSGDGHLRSEMRNAPTREPSLTSMGFEVQVSV